jgi:SAM-dependent methyltransferase
MKCRHCENGSFIPFADLQNSPASNSMLSRGDLSAPETFYPLVVQTCDSCFLAQIGEHKKASDIFDADYTYFSSYSSSWLAHSELFAKAAIKRFELGSQSKVVEIASNDGYLLQYFVRAGVPVLGVEPTGNTAAVAESKGIPTIVDFFGKEFARNELVEKGHRADLIVGNNVFAHVPDINDFTAGLKTALSPRGVISLEFPHLLCLIEENQFDTIYHEHFSYLSLAVTQSIFERQGLAIFDVERLTTHGGSLRVFGAHAEDSTKVRSASVDAVLAEEQQAGLSDRVIYEAFQPRIDQVRADFLRFLLDQRKAGKKVAAYGAAAKGNTLLNYCGVKGDELIAFVCDLSPHKQGRFLPGSHLPVLSPDALDEYKPDFIIIFPWNLKTEIMEQLSHVRQWGAKFVVAVPELTVS